LEENTIKQVRACLRTGFHFDVLTVFQIRELSSLASCL